jgi:hypothetical protein
MVEEAAIFKQLFINKLLDQEILRSAQDDIVHVSVMVEEAAIFKQLFINKLWDQEILRSAQDDIVPVGVMVEEAAIFKSDPGFIENVLLKIAASSFTNTRFLVILSGAKDLLNSYVFL